MVVPDYIILGKRTQKPSCVKHRLSNMVSECIYRLQGPVCNMRSTFPAVSAPHNTIDYSSLMHEDPDVSVSICAHSIEVHQKRQTRLPLRNMPSYLCCTLCSGKLTVGGLRTHFPTRIRKLFIFFQPAYAFIYLSFVVSFLSIKAY